MRRMGQEFHVLRCFSCQTFQVHQVKKSKKWSCKMCGEKQSLIKVYGQGSGADCRRHVQRLNTLRGDMLQAEDHLALMSWQETIEEPPVDQPICSGNQQEGEESRWSKYLNKTDENTTVPVEQEDEENVYMDRNSLHTQRGLHNRKHRRSWASVSDKTPGPTETCNQWKRAKDVKGEETNDLEPSMQASAMASLPNGSCSKHKYSTTSQQVPAPQASVTTRSSENVCVFPVSGEKTERETSKWGRFLPQPGNSETVCEQEGSPVQVTNYKCRLTAAQVNLCHSYQLQFVAKDGNRVLGNGTLVETGSMSSGPKDLPSHCGTTPGCQPELPYKQPHPLLYSLFQTDEDFDV